MLSITHAAVALVVGKFLGFDAFNLLILTLFSVLPDIDHPFSYIGKTFRPISYKVHEFWGHRGFTHSLMFMANIVPLCFYFGIGLPCLIGLALHILLDMTTYMGVKLLYPIRINFVIFDGILKTGKAVDYGLFFLSIVLFVWLTWT